MKGCYILLLLLKRDCDVEIGALGRIHFSKGYYAYVGSAMNGIEGRVRRHLRKEKNVHWHIDYFLREAKIVDVFIKSSKKKLECKIAEGLSKDFEVVVGFGSSDCNCRGHLFYGTKKEFGDFIKNSEFIKFISK